MYKLKFGSQKISVYCHMGNFGCGDGGWTLAMKINGAKVKQFSWCSEVMYIQSLEGYNQDRGFGQNTGRDSGNVNGVWDLTATREAGLFAFFGHVCRIGEENDIRDSQDRNAGCGILVKKKRECGIRTALS